MFKSSFSKYLTAFVAIILIAFLMLSGIITSMIRTHVTADKELKLQNSCEIIAGYIDALELDNLGPYVQSTPWYTQTLAQLVKADYDFNMLITDASGVVLLSTYQTTLEGLPSCYGDLGHVPLIDFTETQSSNGSKFICYRGELDI